MCNADTSRSRTDNDLTARNPDTATHDARDLVRDGATACIRLDNEVYTLRITRAGKLILTK